MKHGVGGRQSTVYQDMWVKTSSSVFTKMAPGIDNRQTERKYDMEERERNTGGKGEESCQILS